MVLEYKLNKETSSISSYVEPYFVERVEGDGHVTLSSLIRGFTTSAVNVN